MHLENSNSCLRIVGACHSFAEDCHLRKNTVSQAVGVAFIKVVSRVRGVCAVRIDNTNILSGN